MGKTLHHRADLFSLGSVLYQMAVVAPHPSTISTIAVLRRVAEDTPRALQEIIPDISRLPSRHRTNCCGIQRNVFSQRKKLPYYWLAASLNCNPPDW